MNPYMQITEPKHSAYGHGTGLTWEMMVAEAAYKAFTAIERAKDALFGQR